MEDAGVEAVEVVGRGCHCPGGWGEQPADGPVETAGDCDEFVGGELFDTDPVDRPLDGRVARSRPAHSEERFERRGGLGLAPPRSVRARVRLNATIWFGVRRFGRLGTSPTLRLRRPAVINEIVDTYAPKSGLVDGHP